MSLIAQNDFEKSPLAYLPRLSASLLIGVALAEAILFLRVYALSGRSKKMMAWLVFQFFVSRTTPTQGSSSNSYVHSRVFMSQNLWSMFCFCVTFNVRNSGHTSSILPSG